jgi:hypothetical protein
MRLPALALFPFLVLNPASSAELKTRLAVKDLQYAEQIIAAAIERQDFGELRRQSASLLSLADRIPPNESDDTRTVCSMAAGNLRVLADDLSDPTSARKAVIARRTRGLYLETMGFCEKGAGLEPPATPNLR